MPSPLSSIAQAIQNAVQRTGQAAQSAAQQAVQNNPNVHGVRPPATGRRPDMTANPTFNQYVQDIANRPTSEPWQPETRGGGRGHEAPARPFQVPEQPESRRTSFVWQVQDRSPAPNNPFGEPQGMTDPKLDKPQSHVTPEIRQMADARFAFDATVASPGYIHALAGQDGDLAKRLATRYMDDYAYKLSNGYPHENLDNDTIDDLTKISQRPTAQRTVEDAGRILGGAFEFLSKITRAPVEIGARATLLSGFNNQPKTIKPRDVTDPESVQLSAIDFNDLPPYYRIKMDSRDATPEMAGYQPDPVKDKVYSRLVQRYQNQLDDFDYYAKASTFSDGLNTLLSAPAVRTSTMGGQPVNEANILGTGSVAGLTSYERRVEFLRQLKMNGVTVDDADLYTLPTGWSNEQAARYGDRLRENGTSLAQVMYGMGTNWTQLKSALDATGIPATNQADIARSLGYTVTDEEDRPVYRTVGYSEAGIPTQEEVDQEHIFKVSDPDKVVSYDEISTKADSKIIDAKSLADIVGASMATQWLADVKTVPFQDFMGAVFLDPTNYGKLQLVWQPVGYLFKGAGKLASALTKGLVKGGALTADVGIGSVNVVKNLFGKAAGLEKDIIKPEDWTHVRDAVKYISSETAQSTANKLTNRGYFAIKSALAPQYAKGGEDLINWVVDVLPRLQTNAREGRWTEFIREVAPGAGGYVATGFNSIGNDLSRIAGDDDAWVKFLGNIIKPLKQDVAKEDAEALRNLAANRDFSGVMKWLTDNRISSEVMSKVEPDVARATLDANDLINHFTSSYKSGLLTLSEKSLGSFDKNISPSAMRINDWLSSASRFWTGAVLTARPGWNMINYLDNSARLLLNGFNPSADVMDMERQLNKLGVTSAQMREIIYGGNFMDEAAKELVPVTPETMAAVKLARNITVNSTPDEIKAALEVARAAAESVKTLPFEARSLADDAIGKLRATLDKLNKGKATVSDVRDAVGKIDEMARQLYGHQGVIDTPLFKSKLKTMGEYVNVMRQGGLADVWSNWVQLGHEVHNNIEAAARMRVFAPTFIDKYHDALERIGTSLPALPSPEQITARFANVADEQLRAEMVRDTTEAYAELGTRLRGLINQSIINPSGIPDVQKAVEQMTLDPKSAASIFIHAMMPQVDGKFIPAADPLVNKIVRWVSAPFGGMSIDDLRNPQLVHQAIDRAEATALNHLNVERAEATMMARANEILKPIDGTPSSVVNWLADGQVTNPTNLDMTVNRMLKIQSDMETTIQDLRGEFAELNHVNYLDALDQAQEQLPGNLRAHRYNLMRDSFAEQFGGEATLKGETVNVVGATMDKDKNVLLRLEDGRLVAAADVSIADKRRAWYLDKYLGWERTKHGSPILSKSGVQEAYLDAAGNLRSARKVVQTGEGAFVPPDVARSYVRRVEQNILDNGGQLPREYAKPLAGGKFERVQLVYDTPEDFISRFSSPGSGLGYYTPKGGGYSLMDGIQRMADNWAELAKKADAQSVDELVGVTINGEQVALKSGETLDQLKARIFGNKTDRVSVSYERNGMKYSLTNNPARQETLTDVTRRMWRDKVEPVYIETRGQWIPVFNPNAPAGERVQFVRSGIDQPVAESRIPVELGTSIPDELGGELLNAQDAAEPVEQIAMKLEDGTHQLTNDLRVQETAAAQVPAEVAQELPAIKTPEAWSSFNQKYPRIQNRADLIARFNQLRESGVNIAPDFGDKMANILDAIDVAVFNREPGQLVRSFNITDVKPEGGLFQRINLDTPEFHKFFDGSKATVHSSVNPPGLSVIDLPNGKFSVEGISGDFDTWEEASLAAQKKLSENDSPLVLYHGTPSAGFSQFDLSHAQSTGMYGPGIYMTESPEIATGNGADWLGYSGREVLGGTLGDRVDNAKRFFEETYGGGSDDAAIKGILDQVDENTTADQFLSLIDKSKISHAIKTDMAGDTTKFFKREKIVGGAYPLYASIKEPFNIDKTYSGRELDDFVSRLTSANKNIGRVIKSDIEEMRASSGGLRDQIGISGQRLYDGLVFSLDEDKAEVNRLLKDAGFDGIMHTGGSNTGNAPHRVFIAFEPGQVKSAIANRGTFDITNPDMLYQLASQEIARGAPEAKNWFMNPATEIEHAKVLADQLSELAKNYPASKGTIASDGTLLFHDAEGKVVGAHMIDWSGKTSPVNLLYFSKDATEDTALEEMAHGVMAIWQNAARFVPGDANSEIRDRMAKEIREIADAAGAPQLKYAQRGQKATRPVMFNDLWKVDLKASGFMDDAGVLDTARWNAFKEQARAADERAAEWLKTYFKTGIAPTPELKGTFQRFKEWLSSFFSRWNETQQLPVSMKRIFDGWLTEDPRAAWAQQLTKRGETLLSKANEDTLKNAAAMTRYRDDLTKALDNMRVAFGRWNNSPVLDSSFERMSKALRDMNDVIEGRTTKEIAGKRDAMATAYDAFTKYDETVAEGGKTNQALAAYQKASEGKTPKQLLASFIDYHNEGNIRKQDRVLSVLGFKLAGMTSEERAPVDEVINNMMKEIDKQAGANESHELMNQIKMGEKLARSPLLRAQDEIEKAVDAAKAAGIEFKDIDELRKIVMESAKAVEESPEVADISTMWSEFWNAYADLMADGTWTGERYATEGKLMPGRINPKSQGIPIDNLLAQERGVPMSNEELAALNMPDSTYVPPALVDILKYHSSVKDYINQWATGMRQAVDGGYLPGKALPALSPEDMKLAQDWLNDQYGNVTRAAEVAQRQAEDKTKLVMMDFETTYNLDTLMQQGPALPSWAGRMAGVRPLRVGGIVPFFKFPRENIESWINTLGNHPAVLHNFQRYQEYGNIQRKQFGLPEAFVPTWPVQVGDKTFSVSPFAFISLGQVLRPFSPYIDEDQTGTEQAIALAGQAGLSLGPTSRLALKILGLTPSSPLQAFTPQQMLLPPGVYPYMSDDLQSILGLYNQQDAFNTKRQMIYDAVADLNSVTTQNAKQQVIDDLLRSLRDDTTPRAKTAREHYLNMRFQTNFSGYFGGVYPREMSPGELDYREYGQQLAEMRSILQNAGLTEDQIKTVSGWMYSDPRQQARQQMSLIYAIDKTHAEPEKQAVSLDQQTRMMGRRSEYYQKRANIEATYQQKYGFAGTTMSDEDRQKYMNELDALSQEYHDVLTDYKPTKGYGETQASFENELKNVWLDYLQNTKPQYTSFKTYTEYERAVDEWNKNLPNTAAELWGTIAGAVSKFTGGTETGGMPEYLKAASTSQQMDRFESQYHTVSQAIYNVLRDNYYNGYWDAVSGKNGARRLLAEMEYEGRYPTPDANKIRGWLEGGKYQGRFTAGDVQRELAAHPVADISQRLTANLTLPEQQAFELSDLLGRIPPGREYFNFRDSLPADLQKHLQTFQDSSYKPVPSKWWGDMVDALKQAIEKEYPKPTLNTVREWSQAENENDQLKSERESRSPGISKTLDTYNAIDRNDEAARKQFRVAHPEINQYYDWLYNNWQTSHPVWGKYYGNLSDTATKKASSGFTTGYSSYQRKATYRSRGGGGGGRYRGYAGSASYTSSNGQPTAAAEAAWQGFRSMVGSDLYNSLTSHWDSQTELKDTELTLLQSVYKAYPFGAKDFTDWLNNVLPNMRSLMIPGTSIFGRYGMNTLYPEKFRSGYPWYRHDTRLGMQFRR